MTECACVGQVDLGGVRNAIDNIRRQVAELRGKALYEIPPAPGRNRLTTLGRWPRVTSIERGVAVADGEIVFQDEVVVVASKTPGARRRSGMFA